MDDYIEPSDYETVQETQRAVSKVDDHVSRIPGDRLREILASNPKQTENLRGVLIEVGKSYDTIYDAITSFISSGATPGPLDPRPFVDMKGGNLKTKIDLGRGRCNRIHTYYYGESGGGGEGTLQFWITSTANLSGEDLVAADQALDDLSEADEDLFTPMAEVGNVLTNKSSTIYNLLSRQQEDTARRLVRKLNDEMLESLQTELSNAKLKLQRQARHLGIDLPTEN